MRRDLLDPSSHYFIHSLDAPSFLPAERVLSQGETPSGGIIYICETWTWLFHEPCCLLLLDYLTTGHVCNMMCLTSDSPFQRVWEGGRTESKSPYHHLFRFLMPHSNYTTG